MIAHAYIANTQYIPNALGMADTLGDRIREQRDKLGMSQAALGDAVGVRQPTMWRYEASRLRPSADALDRIATALGVTSRWLLHGDEDGAAAAPESRVTYDRDEAIDAAADSAKLDDEQRARLYDACRSIGPMSAGELLQTAERIARNARTAGLAHPKNVDRTEVDPKRDIGNRKRYGG